MVHGETNFSNPFFVTQVTLQKEKNLLKEQALTLFVPGYSIPTFDQGCADLRAPDKILTRATAVLKLLQHRY